MIRSLILSITTLLSLTMLGGCVKDTVTGNGTEDSKLVTLRIDIPLQVQSWTASRADGDPVDGIGEVYMLDFR